jgi:hypothetical protein
VLFYVLFVCKCVLYYCHRVATQLQLNISSYHTIYIIYHIIYHIISYIIISYHISSYHIIYHIISYHIISHHIIISYNIISYHIIYHIISYIISYRIISYRIVSYHISYHITYHISYLDTGFSPFRHTFFFHLDIGFSWFSWVQERMLRWFPPFQVAFTCFSCSPPDLNSVVTNCLLLYYVK